MNLGVPNFSAHPVKNEQNGETYTEYQITRDGFTFLQWVLPAKKATAFREAYINEFNRLEEQVRNNSQAKELTPH